MQADANGDGGKLVIVGDGEFAEIAYEYFVADSDFEVCAFAVEKAYRQRDQLRGLPVIDLEDISAHYPPKEYHAFVAITFTKLNRVRARLFEHVKSLGYECATYVSSKAYVWPGVEFGENCFVFEDNTIQPFTRFGRNIILWSGNHVGHRAVIEDHCFISSHVVISGYCRIGENSFLGVNATLADNVTVARDNWIGPGITLIKDTEPGQLYGAVQPPASKVSTYRFFKIKER